MRYNGIHMYMICGFGFVFFNGDLTPKWRMSWGKIYDKRILGYPICRQSPQSFGAWPIRTVYPDASLASKSIVSLKMVP